MRRSQLRLFLLLAALPVVVLTVALLYMAGMSRLEGEARDFWSSLEWAAGALSTTGFGPDTTWRHPAMVLFVVAAQFTGVILFFLVVPVYLIPFLEERFEARLPRQLAPLSGHLVIFRFGPAVETLLAEVEAAGVPVVVVEEDRALARRLVEERRRVLFGRLSEEVLARARLNTARALIVNGSDDENAAAILSARQLGFAGEILALVEEPLHRRPMALAGASRTFTPRHLLAAALAARASTRISPTVSGLDQLGGGLCVRELRVERGSALAGRTLAEAQVGQITGVSVLGLWSTGKLVTPATGRTRVEAGSILVAAGSEANLGRLAAMTGGSRVDRGSGRFVVGGYGEVGRVVVELLRSVGEQVLVIDRRAQEGVDLIGDVLDSRLLETAGVAKAQAVVLALDNDSATLFGTVIVRDLAPDVPIVARVNQAINVERIHRAGADFALSISQVSGQVLAQRLLGEEAVSLEPGLRLVKIPAGALAGQRAQDLRLREELGCSIVAVERKKELITQLEREFKFEAGDDLFVCGSGEAVRNFRRRFAPSEESRSAAATVPPAAADPPARVG